MTRLTQIVSAKAATVALAAVVFAGATFAGSAPANAWHPHHHRHHGGAIVGGVAAGLLIGGALAASSAYAAPVARNCVLEDRFDRFGNYIRTVRVCQRVVY